MVEEKALEPFTSVAERELRPIPVWQIVGIDIHTIRFGIMDELHRLDFGPPFKQSLANAMHAVDDAPVA